MDTEDKGVVHQFTTTSLKRVESTKKTRKSTGMYEFDRVLGGGIVPGSIVLLTGEPGVGKSTLLLQALQSINTLYISGEESAEQVKDRAERLKVNLDSFSFSADLQVEAIINGMNELKNTIDVMVVDSVQTLYSKDIDGPPGTVSQLREGALKLISAAKKLRIPLLLIGHVTKEGEIAGPKTLEHMVDVVLNFEGERISQFRILRASKNRFGSTDEIGIFEMHGMGLAEVNNPLAFLEHSKNTVPGKSIVGIMEGKRPLFYEIQCLASQTMLPMPRRVVRGIDYNKLLLLLAVVRKSLNIPLDKYDIYVNVIGGVDVKSPAADLGVVGALVSSLKGIPLPSSSVFIGEVGLLGEVRKVYSQEKVIAEATRLKFKHVVSPETISSVREIKNYLTAE